MNDVVKQSVSSRLGTAINKEELKKSEAAACLGIKDQYVHMMLNPDLWKKCPVAAWEAARWWTNSGETLKSYKDHKPELDEIKAKVKAHKDKAGAEKGEKITERRTARRGVSQPKKEADKTEPGVDNAGTFSEYPAGMEVDVLKKMDTDEVINRVNQKIESSGLTRHQAEVLVTRELIEETKELIEKEYSKPQVDDENIVRLGREIARELRYPDVRVPWNVCRYRLKPILLDGQISYLLQKRVLLWWKNQTSAEISSSGMRNALPVVDSDPRELLDLALKLSKPIYVKEVV